MNRQEILKAEFLRPLFVMTATGKNFVYWCNDDKGRWTRNMKRFIQELLRERKGEQGHFFFPDL